jgi:hypothetical protein
MRKSLISQRSFCILSGLSGIVGVALILLSFNINPGPPPDAAGPELMKFGEQHYVSVLWGAWLQAVGPLLIVLFAFSLVQLAGATQRLSGWMTFFGGTILMTVILIEITFYISALHPDPAMIPSISLVFISAVQHLYFIAAAPNPVLSTGDCSYQLLDTPSGVWVFGALVGISFCSFRSHFSARSLAARASYSICWSPSVLVVGRCHHTHSSQWKNRERPRNKRRLSLAGGLVRILAPLGS